MPEANIILGVSNVSFGLNPAARVVLNSVFLHDCVEAGMNSAIVNASKILPLIRFNEHEIETARDLIFARDVAPVLAARILKKEVNVGVS